MNSFLPDSLPAINTPHYNYGIPREENPDGLVYEFTQTCGNVLEVIVKTNAGQSLMRAHMKRILPASDKEKPFSTFAIQVLGGPVSLTITRNVLRRLAAIKISWGALGHHNFTPQLPEFNQLEEEINVHAIQSLVNNCEDESNATSTTATA